MSYEKWKADFNKQIQAATKLNKKTLIEAANEFLRRVQERTPAGNPALWNYPAPANYVPGALKASWAISFTNAGDSGVYATVQNYQPYAERVEFGWSSQAPQGMLRITMKEWQQIINEKAGQNGLK